MTKRGATFIWSIATFLLALVWFRWVALERFASGDEGFYLYAAELVAEGRVPYRDFFYPQMPLAPYLYALPGFFAKLSWESARLFTACLAAVTTMVLFRFLARTLAAPTALAFAILFALSPFTFPWLVVAQTYPLSVLFLLLAVVFASRSDKTTLSIVAAGIFFGLSIDVRLFFAGLLPLFLLYGWCRPGERGFRTWLLYFFAGLVVGLLPNLPFLLFDWEGYWFNNLGYHIGRSPRSLSESLEHKGKVLQVVLGLRDSQKFVGFDLSLLLWASGFALLFSLVRRSLPPLPLLIGFGLVGLSFLPEPTYVQYFSTAVPFLLIGTLSLVREMKPALVVVVLGLAVAVNLSSVSENIEKYTSTGAGVLGIPNARLASERKVAFLDSIASDLQREKIGGEAFVSMWPGYLVGSGLRVRSGFENHFTFRAGEQLTTEEQQQFHVTRLDRLLSQLQKGHVTHVLGWRRDFRGPLGRELTANGFEVERSWGKVELRVRSESVPTTPHTEH